MLLGADIQRLMCPQCRAPLAASTQHMDDKAVWRPQSIRCAGCGTTWPIQANFLQLYQETQVKGNDRLLRLFYNGLPRLHNPTVRYVLPLLQFGTEKTLRDGYMRRLNLAGLQPRKDGQPLRILEVGVGGGANLPLLMRDLPRGLNVEIWGLDLAVGMLQEARRLVKKKCWNHIRLLLSDAHALPFADHSFDRVFHVGGIGGYSDPAKAMAEMARVARPATPVVVCDEQLDAKKRNGLYHKAMFKALTFYDKDPHCPREFVPTDATDVVEEQVSRFYYCLSFRTAQA